MHSKGELYRIVCHHLDYPALTIINYCDHLANPHIFNDVINEQPHIASNPFPSSWCFVWLFVGAAAISSCRLIWIG